MTAHPIILSGALFERDGKVLTVHRRRRPLAGQWLLPLTPVALSETAEDAVKRHAHEQFGVDVSRESFADTVYIEDPADKQQYVANIFRADITSGPMRFRADGDYDDARWLAPTDLEQLWMPPPLRASAMRLLAEPHEDVGGVFVTSSDSSPVSSAPSPDAAAVTTATTQGVPLAERDLEPGPPVTGPSEPSAPEPPPDNRAGWNAIAKAYQEEIFGERHAGKLMWSWTHSEDDLRLLDDVAGKHVLVLGCGGGQDVIALSEMGAIATGVDVSEEQIAYARRLASKRYAVNASFVVGTAEDLSRFDDASFDAAVSAHMLNYVERIEDTLRETSRVLRAGGVFALSVRHPFDAMVSEDAPYRLTRAYWDTREDWTWAFEGKASARFRQWFWTIQQWFEMLSEAGFTIERLLELTEADERRGERAAMLPSTLALRARKR